MITDLFLNSCFSVVLNKNTTVRRDKAIYRDILELLDSFKKQQKNEIPVNVKNKVECLHEMCQLKLSNKTDDNVIDSMLFGQKFRGIADFLITKRNEELKDEIIIDNICQIKNRKKLNIAIKNQDKMTNFLDVIRSGNFDSIDEVISSFEGVVKEAHFNLSECDRSADMESSASLDLLEDDFDSVLKMIQKKYNRQNTIQSGFPAIDNSVFDMGGFEKSRLYIFGGGSGSGKSTFMLNCINNDLIRDRQMDTENTGKVYLYITLENLIDESLLRLYQMMFSKTKVEALRDISLGIDIKNKILNHVKNSGNILILKYFKKYSISCTDIMMQLDNVIDKYGKESVRALYVDYLDLLKADITNELYRLELGFITSGLKDIAVDYNIPVITASQLGRSVYRNQDSKSLNMDMMSESIKKIEHADFIALMSKNQIDSNKVHFKVSKNRCGKDNITLDFNVRFDMYKFLDGLPVSNQNRQDAASDQQFIEIDTIKQKDKKTKKSPFRGLSSNIPLG